MNSLRHVDLLKVFVVDIETAPCAADPTTMPTDRRALWDVFCGKRHNKDLEAGQTTDELFGKASLYAEFGQVVCISVGFFYTKNDELRFRVKSFASEDECEVLRGFAELLGEKAPFGQRGGKLPGSSPEGHYLCAHNGREFDYAYLGRRMVICGIPLPPMLDIAGFKPWDLPHLLDTMEMWKFGDNKGFTSLALLAHVFGIPSPKDDISGADVGRVFWQDRDLDRISTYCQKDVETTARVLLHFRGTKELWDETHVERVPLRQAAGAMRVV